MTLHHSYVIKVQTFYMYGINFYAILILSRLFVDLEKRPFLRTALQLPTSN